MEPAAHQQLLDQLRDLQLPRDPGWWPPAPGWWVLMALLIGLGVCLYRFHQRRRSGIGNTSSWQQSAVQELSRLQQIPLDTDANRSAVLAGASVLMRRVAIAVAGRSATAALTGDNWLRLLDSLSGNRRYSAGEGKLLALQPYMQPGSIKLHELESLLTLMGDTIESAPHAAATRINSDGTNETSADV